MRSIRKALLYGFLMWLIPFLVAFLMYPLKSANRPLWESIMPVVISISAVFFCVLYFIRLEARFLQEGVLLGLMWLAISVGLDLLLFMKGPMAMPFTDYVVDIGLTYLLIPVVSIGFGFLLKNVSGRMQERTAKGR